MKQKTYYITGMHCASCELLIEKKVLKLEGIEAADASTFNGTLVLSYRKSTPEPEELTKMFVDDGYMFSYKKGLEKKSKLFRKTREGISLDRAVGTAYLKTGIKVLIVLVILWMIERSGIAQSVSINDTSSLGLFFFFGLVAGLSSCAALIGGVLLSLSKQGNESYSYDTPVSTKIMPHISFHAGRILAYIVFGGILGGIGSSIALDNVTAFAFVTIVVSLIMLLLGLQMAGVSWAQKFQLRMPKFVTKKVSETDGVGSRLPLLIGAGTILLPCGFTLAAQGVALTSGSAIRGALLMLYFVLGTMIPLLVIGFASISGTSSPRRAKAFSFYAGVVLVIFGMYNVNAQFNVLGWNSASDIFVVQNSDADLSISTKTYVPKDGEQVIHIVAKNFDYYLQSSATIEAGKPTTLVIDDQGMRGCGRYLAARGLFDGYKILQPGIQEIHIPNPEPGTYKITCTMGMVPPVIINVI